jgi:hypothetical protein
VQELKTSSKKEHLASQEILEEEESTVRIRRGNIEIPSAVRSQESCTGFKPKGVEEEPRGDIGILAASGFHKVENRDLESPEILRKDLNRRSWQEV